MPAFEFNLNELAQLNRLRFMIRGTRPDDASGLHRTTLGGEGTDFLDYRSYVAGDDFRKIDWNLYSRLRQLFIRLHETPRQVSMSIAVDCSQSMLFGTPTKLETSQRIASALSYVCLQSGDRVYVSTFAGERLRALGPLTGRQGFRACRKLLVESPAGGQSNLLAIVRKICSERRRGMVVLVSDFLNVGDTTEAIQLLRAMSLRALLVQVLCPLDRGVGLSGTLRLRDSESGRLVDVKLNAKTIREYQTRFELQRCELVSQCRNLGHSYLLVNNSDHHLRVVCQALATRMI